MEKKDTTISIAQEFKILRAIERVFSDNHNTIIPKDDNYGVTCPANVSLIVAKSEFGKKLLLRFLNIVGEGENGKPPITLDYFTAEKEIPKSKYSLEYIYNLLEIFKYDDSVSISLKKDFPMTIENKDFRVILAPRIEDEEIRENKKW